jgi:hypothetical protein
MPVLSEALGREALLPERRPARLEEVLRQYPALQNEVTQKEVTGEDSSGEDSPESSKEDSGSVLFIDGTERRIRRPTDPGRRKTFYSGKKKGHTVKNVLLTGPARQVLYLSGTYEGKRADKRIADEEGYCFPEGTTLYQDKGFQGYAPPGATIRQPKKKPKGRELTDVEKAENSATDAVRVRVEHAIGGGRKPTGSPMTSIATTSKDSKMRSWKSPVVCTTSGAAPERQDLPPENAVGGLKGESSPPATIVDKI